MDFSNKSIIEALRHESPALLPDFLAERRWFAGKARQIRGVRISDIIPIPCGETSAYLLLVAVNYASGPEDLYDIPLVLVANSIPSRAVSSRLRIYSSELQRDLEFQDALSDTEFLSSLLKAILDHRAFAGSSGRVKARAASSEIELIKPSQLALIPVLNRGEQSNSSIFYGNELILKIFRRLEAGINPDLEIGTFLTEKTAFRNIAPVAGSLEYVRNGGGQISLGILEAFVPNHGDAWEFTLRQFAEYFERTRTLREADALQTPEGSILSLSDHPAGAEARQNIGEYLTWATLLGQRTAELHLALASATGEDDFTAETYTEADQRAFIESSQTLLRSTFQILRGQLPMFPPDTRKQAQGVLRHEEELHNRLQDFERSKILAVKTRIHGDYHLGQVLFTGKDFVIIDFEGEPSRPLAERRKKRSPLQDVAGMLRSFDYAVSSSVQQNYQDEPDSSVASAAIYLQKWVSAAFLQKYCEVAGNAIFIPPSRSELELMLNTFLLDKAVYELGYELNNRPAWVPTPLGGISQLIGVVA